MKRKHKILDLNIEVEITKKSDIGILILKYDRRQPIVFKCPACGKYEHLRMNVMWKRNNLLCHSCLIQDQAKFFSQDLPLDANLIAKQIKPISKTQNISFVCSKCHQPSIIQYRHFSGICEHCKRQLSAKQVWERPGYKDAWIQNFFNQTGFYNPFQDKEHLYACWGKKYGKGIHSAMQIPEYQAKQQQKMNELYGGCTLASPILRPIVDTSVKKLYGATNIRNTKYYQEKFEDFKDNLYKNLKKMYSLDGIFFDSSWEVAFYIWLRDSSLNFEYHPVPGIQYISNGKIHTYYPDFVVDGEIIEIKGDQFFNIDGTWKWKDQQTADKYKTMNEHNVIVYRRSDIKFYLDYVKEIYGKNYLASLKIKDQKSNI